MNFAAFTAIAAVTVTQMLRARDNLSGQALDDAFASCSLQGLGRRNAKSAPENAHPPNTLTFATWVIARLGAWTGYYSKLGPASLSEAKVHV